MIKIDRNNITKTLLVFGISLMLSGCAGVNGFLDPGAATVTEGPGVLPVETKAPEVTERPGENEEPDITVTSAVAPIDGPTGVNDYQTGSDKPDQSGDQLLTTPTSIPTPTSTPTPTLTPTTVPEVTKTVTLPQGEVKARLMFAGDICLSENYFTYLKYLSENGTASACFSEEYLKLMRDADVFFVNNEFPFTTSTDKLTGKLYNFKADPLTVDFLVDMGVDICGLANNHVYDYKAKSLTDTLDTITNAGMSYVGAGRNINEASEPFVLNVNGIKIAFVMASKAEKNRKTPEATDSAAGILLCYDETKFINAIKKADNNADLVIAVIHWGKENSEQLESDQYDIASRLINAGADAVIGGHSHVIQGIDYYKGKPIFYSLGDYWFDYYTEDTFLLELDVLSDNGEYSLQPIVHPGVQKEGVTRYEGGTNDGARILKHMNELSDSAVTDIYGRVYDKSYAPKDDALFAFDVKKASKENFSPEIKDLSEAGEGDFVRFGKYPTKKNGNKGDIIWQVIEKTDEGLKLIALNILDHKSYDDDNGSVSWEGSSICKWLNSTFYDAAFSNDEKNRIIVSGSDNVTLLDKSGYKKALSVPGIRLYAAPTEYAFYKGLYVYDPVTKKIKCTEWAGFEYSDSSYGCWYIKDNGILSNTAAFVNEHGNLIESGIFTGAYSYSDGLTGIRPVITVKR